MRQSGMALIKGRGLCEQGSSQMAICPSVWGKVELSLGLHPALIPAACHYVISHQRGQIGFSLAAESGKWEDREIPLPLLCR